jgi:beta-glucosidase
VVVAVNAGVDMVMVPLDYQRFIAVMHEAVAAGRIPMARIDDAVRRILRAKTALGLNEGPGRRPPLGEVGSAQHRTLAAEAVRKSAVLLRDDVLPIGGVSTIKVAGTAADDIGLQCGGWTVGWQGSAGRTTDGSTLLDGLRAAFAGEIEYQPEGEFSGNEQAEVGIVCLAERPYAEGPGDAPVPTLTEADREVFERVRRRCRKVVLIIYSGRPLVIPELIDASDAVVAAWLPGSEAAAIADLLLGEEPFRGRLPQPWPGSAADLDDAGDPRYAVGHGLEGSGRGGA